MVNTEITDIYLLVSRNTTTNFSILASTALS
jgi:hypothetical protein